MALIPCPVITFTGIKFPKALPIQKSHLVFRKDFRSDISKTRRQFFIREGYGAKYAISIGRHHDGHNLYNDVKGPFWLAPTNGIIGGLKSLFAFLAEQPSQLKYIEWPGFRNTVKTAALTLVLVAMLIVVLSSVDSGLWYLLASILRKPA